MSLNLDEIRVVYCTCPDQESAGRIARIVVAGQLAACVNILPGVISVYRWQDEVREAAEFLLVIKTTHARYRQLEALLKRHHPYDTPEVLALPVVAGSEQYLDWVRAGCAPQRTKT